MTIAGKSVRSADTFQVPNPATGEVVGDAPRCSEVELDQAVGAAVDAYAGWAADEPLRRTMLGSISAVLKENVDGLSQLITAEQGKPLNESRIEILGSARWMRWYAEFTAEEELIQDDARGRVSDSAPTDRPSGCYHPLELPNHNGVLEAGPGPPCRKSGCP